MGGSSQNLSRVAAGLMASLCLLGVAKGAVRVVQGPPEGAPPPGGPPPWFGPEGGPGMMRRPGMPPPGGPTTMLEEGGLTPALVPADALTVYLSLSEDQRKKVEAAIDGLRNALVALRPRRPPTDTESLPPPPSREERETMRATVRAAHERADRAIADALTQEQRQRLPIVLSALDAVQSAGITLSAAARMHLTPEQIDTIARSKSFRAIRLTDTQREIAELNPDRAQRNFR